MTRPTIDYLNARRESSGRKGKAIFKTEKQLVNDRAQWNQLERWEQALMECDAIMSEFNSWVRNSWVPDVQSSVTGESLDDLSF